jgi:hypothetical protein
LAITRDRLNYSFIWDRYSLFTVDENALMDGGITIDPTNKNINLKAEISKLVKKQHIHKNNKNIKQNAQGGQATDSDFTSEDSPGRPG